MSLVPIILKPGITTEATQTLAKGGWSKSNGIRWRDGYLEKQIGWSHLCDTAVTGRGRTLHDWVDTGMIKYMAVGTHLRLQVFSGGVLTDITPLRATHNVAVVVDTVISTPTCTVTDTAHGALTNDEVYFIVPVAVGGLILYGAYQITVVDADNYTITAASNATATVNNGGAVPLYTTTNGSPTVKVTLAAHGKLAGTAWIADVSTTVATIVITGEYLVDSVIDANNFNIVAASSANASTTGSENGGNARYQYNLAAGLESTISSIGFGSGGYGRGTWGVGDGTGSGITPLRMWAVDNFGSDLLALVTNAGLYSWTPPISTGGRATIVSGAPTSATWMFVSMPQLQIIELGAEVLGVQDPLLVRYSDIASKTTWTATATNEAGSFRLSRGSRIVGGLQGPLAGLIWTDSDLWQMQYIGLPFIYSFTVIAKGVGLVGPLAACVVDRTVYWMSLQGFFMYGSGTVTPIPSPVWDTIFQNINKDHLDKVVAAASSTQREVTFFYPSAASTEIDSYVKMSVNNPEIWDYGTLTRTGWLDQNVFGTPVGIDANGKLQQHDLTYDNDGSAITGVLAETGYMDIADGDKMMIVDQLIPDFIFKGASNASITLTLKALNQPGGTPVEYGPFTVDATTEFISPQVRARQIALRINCDNLNTWFRLGKIRARISEAGKVA